MTDLLCAEEEKDLSGLRWSLVLAPTTWRDLGGGLDTRRERGVLEILLWEEELQRINVSMQMVFGNRVLASHHTHQNPACREERRYVKNYQWQRRRCQNWRGNYARPSSSYIFRHTYTRTWPGAGGGWKYSSNWPRWWTSSTIITNYSHQEPFCMDTHVHNPVNQQLVKITPRHCQLSTQLKQARKILPCSKLCPPPSKSAG